MALTERQQQIKALRDQDKSAREVAEVLGITVNGVYQQLRRMKAKGGATTAVKKASGAKATKAPAPAVAPVEKTARAMTPLQAIRARKSEIEHELSESARGIAAAQSALTKATERHATVVAKREDELKQLVGAEGVITGSMNAAKKPAPRDDTAVSGDVGSTTTAPTGRKSGSKGAKNSKPEAAAPVAPPEPAPAPAPPAPPAAPPSATPEGPESVEPDPFIGSTMEPAQA